MFEGCSEISISFLSALGDLRFSVPGGQKKLLGCGLLGEISTQADTMELVIPCVLFSFRKLKLSVCNLICPWSCLAPSLLALLEH